MEQFLSDANRLVHHLHNHDSAVDILVSETTNLQNKLIAMKQYHEEVNKMNEIANHRPRSTLILGSQLENQRIQNLEQENRELSISLAEHQSALELIMNKYREQVLVMMKANGTEMAINNKHQASGSEVIMSERIAEMASVMRQSALIDESKSVTEIEILRSLQIENENLRELLEISGGKVPKLLYNFDEMYCNLGGYVTDSKFCPGKNDKMIKAVMNKDSCVYESDHSSLNHNKQVRAGSSNLNRANHYDSLEQLFKKPSEEELNNYRLDTPLPRTYDSSENFFITANREDNCFRAIITDIKPFRENFDVSNDTNQISKPTKNGGKMESETPDTASIISQNHSTEADEKVISHFVQNNSQLTNINNGTIENGADTNTTRSNSSGEKEIEAITLLDDVLGIEDSVDEHNITNKEFHSVKKHYNDDNTSISDPCDSLEDKNTTSVISTDDSKIKNGIFSNGDVSDDDSEATFTEEDVNQALSGFDSFLEDNDGDLH